MHFITQLFYVHNAQISWKPLGNKDIILKHFHIVLEYPASRNFSFVLESNGILFGSRTWVKSGSGQFGPGQFGPRQFGTRTIRSQTIRYQDNLVLGQFGPGQFGLEMTITQKIKIGKIRNLIFLSIQPIPDLSSKFDHFWKKKYFDVTCLCECCILEKSGFSVLTEAWLF